MLGCYVIASRPSHGGSHLCRPRPRLVKAKKKNLPHIGPHLGHCTPALAAGGPPAVHCWEKETQQINGAGGHQMDVDCVISKVLTACLLGTLSLAPGCDSNNTTPGDDSGGSGSLAPAIETGCEAYCHLDMECAFLCSLPQHTRDAGMNACVPHCEEAVYLTQADKEAIARCLSCIGDSYPYCESDIVHFPDNPNVPQAECPACYSEGEDADEWQSFLFNYWKLVWPSVGEGGGTFEGLICPTGGTCSFTCESCSGTTSCAGDDCGPCSEQCEAACANDECGAVLTCF